MVSCEICSKEEHKYKCPTCKILYCSLVCYKVHKEDCEKKEVNPFYIDTKPTSEAAPRVYIDEDREKEIPREVLAKLDESEELKNLLQNPHLRDFLTHVNSTHNPKGFMKIAMREPLFVEFADACLKVVHPELSQEVSDEQIVEHLRGEAEKHEN